MSTTPCATDLLNHPAARQNSDPASSAGEPADAHAFDSLRQAIRIEIEALGFRPMRRPYWTPEELARYLNLDVKCIYERTRRGGPESIPHLKLGKYVRFNPDSPQFVKWLEAHAK